MESPVGLLAVALCALAGCLGCPQQRPIEVVGIRGKEMALEPQLNGSLTGITWKKNEDIVAEWDHHDWFAPPLQNRAKLDPSSGRLTLLKLLLNDSGEYVAEALVGQEIQCTFFSVRILEPLHPPQLNCTTVGDRIQVRCELNALDVTQKISPTYWWRYQKSDKAIPGNNSSILLEKDVDHSENIICGISAYNGNTNSSIPLKSCIPEAARKRRNRGMLLLPFAIVGVLGVIFYLWKRGYLNIRRQEKSQDCKNGVSADETPQEVQHLQRELSENFEEGLSDPSS